MGGWRRVASQGPWGRATAAALASRFGVGNARLWRSPRPGDRPLEVDTVALGAWFAEHLRALGGWNERYLRNQDFELNHRLRRAGGRVVFDPGVWSIYRPRESPAALARQYWDYGRFKALLLVEQPRSLRPRQLAPIALLGKAPIIIVGRNSLPAATLKEFVAYARENPGKATAGYPGNGTQAHISGELLQQRAGINFAQTQYRGSPAIISDILGEHIDVGMDSMAPYVSLIQEKKLRGLAIAGAARWPLLPDVPTVAESGFPGFEATVWYALLAPAGTPIEIIAKLNETANAYLKTKASAELFERLGIQADGGTPDDLKAFIAAELEKLAPIVKAAKIEF